MKKICENCITNTICTYYDKQWKKAHGKCPGWRWIRRCWAIILLCLLMACLVGGCTSWSGLSETYENGELKTRVKARMTQCLTDSSRTNMAFKMKGLGSARVGTSILDAEALADIAEGIYPWWMGVGL